MQNRKHLLATALLFSVTTFNAQATLTTSANGLGVYDSGLNATWTQDGNLLGTLETTMGYSTVINDIINASNGVIYDTPNSLDSNGTHTLTTADFTDSGLTNWWGGQAFIHYLNTIDYGGSNQWALPTTTDTTSGYNITGSQLGELYYTEQVSVTVYVDHKLVTPFSNIVWDLLWSGTENADSPDTAWNFSFFNGNQNNYAGKSSQLYVWAVTPGQLPAAVPLPGAVWLFGSALLGYLGMKRRNLAG